MNQKALSDLNNQRDGLLVIKEESKDHYEPTSYYDAMSYSKFYKCLKATHMQSIKDN